MFRQIKETFKKLYQDEKGQGFAEYGLILALVGIVVIAALAILGPKIAGKINEVSGHLN